MSTYEYIIEVTDKASGFINQFTKTLDRVNRGFGDARIRGTEAFERVMAPVNAIDQAATGLGGKLMRLFDFGTEGEAAIQSTVRLDQQVGGLGLNVDAAVNKVNSFGNSLSIGVNGAEEMFQTLGQVSAAMETAGSNFTEVGNTVANLPLAEAMSGVLSGVTASLDGVLPEAMNEQWNRIREGIETNLLPALTGFSEITGINLDSLSPKIAELSTGFGSFLTENAASIQGFVGQGQQMVSFIGSARGAVGQLTGIWSRYKGVLSGANIMSKVSLVTMKAQKVATLAYEAASGKLSVATKAMTVVQRVLNTVLKSNPIVLIITLLLAGGAALLAFARKSRKVSEETKKMNELQERTNETLAKGEELRKRVNNVDNLTPRQKEDLRSDLQNRQKELEDMRAANQVELNNFDLKGKQAQLNSGNLGRSERRQIKQEIEAYEKLSESNANISKQLVENAAQQKVVNNSLGAPAAEGEASQAQLQEGADGIAAGGKKATNINISLEKMIETLEVHAETLDEGLSEVETKVKEVFLRILNSGNYAAQ